MAVFVHGLVRGEQAVAENHTLRSLLSTTEKLHSLSFKSNYFGHKVAPPRNGTQIDNLNLRISHFFSPLHTGVSCSGRVEGVGVGWM